MPSQNRPLSQKPSFGTFKQASLAPSHESLVQATPSSQSGGVPGAQIPA